MTGIPCDVPVPKKVTSNSRMTLFLSRDWHTPFMSATLASLRIRNLALVEDITWEPHPGFVAITGETGAGKSVILGALKLLLGERADKSVIRSGAETCTVEAEFENVRDARISVLLEENGAEACEDNRLLIKRTLSATAAGRQFVNGSPCTIALLRALGDLLVDLHGPHDHQSLFAREQQTRLLDAFAGARAAAVDFAEARTRFLKLEQERDSILSDEQAAAREIDLLSHQTDEIASAALSSPAEEETLVARQRASANSQKISELCALLLGKTSEDESSLLNLFADLSRACRELERLDPAAKEVSAANEAAFTASQDLVTAIQSYAAHLDNEPGALPEIEARLDILQTLKRKYGATIDEVIAFGEKAETRLAELKGRAERQESLDAEIAASEKAMLEAGKKLSARRASSAKKLSQQIQSGLKDLGFAKSEFSIDLQALHHPGPHGLELAEFLFCPNPGEPARPLRAIASSGEISRVMLALKSALAAQDDVPVLVFDEIDANVGGEIAAKVGDKMRELGEARQVLCITHLPQVASNASSQFVVSKHVRAGRTETQLAPVKGKDRIEEVARMLGGKSDSALAHAKSLLQSAR